MPTDFKTNEVIERVRTARAVVVTSWEAGIAKRETARAAFETRMASTDDQPTDADKAEFEGDETAFIAENDQYKAKLADFDTRLEDLENIEVRRAEAAKNHRPEPGIVRSEPMTYTRETAKGEDGVSYWRDLAQVHVNGITFQGTNMHESLQRLQRHGREMDVEMIPRNRTRERNALTKVSEADQREYDDDGMFRRGQVEHAPELVQRGAKWAHNPFDYRAGNGGYGMEQRVEPNSTQGQGGYFIPPLWQMDQWLQQLVAHLVIAGLVRQMDLPMGTNSINLPKVAGGTAVGYQQANNSGVVTQDWTDTAVTANVKTIAGDSDVAKQLLEQSPNMLVDEVITQNLALQYNSFLDAQVAAGDGVNASQLNGGHIQGIANGAAGTSLWSGVNGVTYTAATPAGYQFAQVLAAMASNVAKTRFSAGAYKTVTTASRWGWYSSAPDANDRPLGESGAGGPFNVQAMINEGFQAEGLVGTVPHVANTPWYVDANLPANGGTGANQDIAISGLFEDAWLFQGALRTNVYPEVLSAGLGIRFQLYNYVAFLLRYGQSFAIASGTGMVPPTGQGSSPSWTPASLTF